MHKEKFSVVVRAVFFFKVSTVHSQTWHGLIRKAVFEHYRLYGYGDDNNRLHSEKQVIVRWNGNCVMVEIDRRFALPVADLEKAQQHLNGIVDFLFGYGIQDVVGVRGELVAHTYAYGHGFDEDLVAAPDHSSVQGVP